MHHAHVGGVFNANAVDGVVILVIHNANVLRIDNNVDAQRTNRLDTSAFTNKSPNAPSVIRKVTDLGRAQISSKGLNEFV